MNSESSRLAVPAATLCRSGRSFAQAKPNSLIDGVQIGTITYSYRSMADQSAEATLKYIVDSGISAIELMGGPVESFAGAPTPAGAAAVVAAGSGRGGAAAAAAERQAELRRMRRAPGTAAVRGPGRGGRGAVAAAAAAAAAAARRRPSSRRPSRSRPTS